MHNRVRDALLLFGLLVCFTVAARADEPKAATPAADSPLGTEAGQVREDNALKMKLVWCPPGIVPMEYVERATYRLEFVNGVSTKTTIDELITPVKAVLTNGFWMGQCEVTRAQWTQLMLNQPWKVDRLIRPGDGFPATWVDWDDASAFCLALTQREREAGRLTDGWEYRLPTEAQWERACRAQSETKFCFGDDEEKLPEYAWFNANTIADGNESAQRVGTRKSNAWGLYDMHGNVWEWCRDRYISKVPGGRNPEVTDGTGHVLRGGSVNDSATDCRSAYRPSPTEPPKRAYIGFRVALTVVRPAADASPR